MAIRRPQKRLLRDVPLQFVRNAAEGGGRKSVDAPIALIPFIDFLVTLVVFLLCTFGANDLSAQRPNLIVPGADHTLDLEYAPIVAIDADAITVDQRRIADTRALAQSSSLERIEPLVAELSRQRQVWSELHPHQPFTGAVILQADRGTDFRVLKKVMFSAAQAGYTNVSFAVSRRP